MESLSQNSELVTTVPKKDIFCKVPYMSNSHNKQFKRSLQDILSKFYPQVNLCMIFYNTQTIYSIFPFKDVIPDELKSNLVYKYTCRICYSTYIGETTRHLKTRIAEQMGISPRTGKSAKKNPGQHFQTPKRFWTSHS